MATTAGKTKKTITKKSVKKTPVVSKAKKVTNPVAKRKTRANKDKKTTASIKYIHMAPRKIRRVANLIRRTTVANAENILVNLPKRASVPLVKALKTAKANAVHNESMDEKRLFINEITVNESMTLSRFRPRAQGRAFPIRKRFSHIDLVLTEMAVDLAKDSEKKVTAKPKTKAVIKETKIK